MADHTELRRKLTAALNTTHLHPDYARGLLRECREALDPRPYALRVTTSEAVPPGEMWFVQDRKIVGRITGLGE